MSFFHQIYYLLLNGMAYDIRTIIQENAFRGSTLSLLEPNSKM